MQEEDVSRVHGGTDARCNLVSRGRKRRNHEVQTSTFSRIRSGKINSRKRHARPRCLRGLGDVQARRDSAAGADLTSRTESRNSADSKNVGNRRRVTGNNRRDHRNRRWATRKCLFATKQEDPELVRDVVHDYIAGQRDPEIADCSIGKTAMGHRIDAPIQAKNRALYIWVVQDASGKFTHDLHAACPTQSLAQLPRKLPCELCGALCLASRLYVVRCYARLRADDVDETHRPRVMRPEIYGVGGNCVGRLLGVPRMQEGATKLARMRTELRSALRERFFSVHKWFSPLRTLTPEGVKSVRVALHDELARIIKDLSGPDAVWRQVARCEKSARRAVSVRSRTSATSCTESFEYHEEEDLTQSPKILEGIPQAPHELYFNRKPRPPYTIVIPSYGRPDRLLSNTLAFLKQQGVPSSKIEIWLAPGKAPGQHATEEERYRSALAKEWPGVRLRIGVKGIMEQRWHIGLQYPENYHIVSFDDDIPAVNFKFQQGTGCDTLRPLPPGAMEALIHHAHDLMLQEGAWIWGLCASSNPMNMAFNTISRKSGMLNGFMYGWRVRHDPSLRSIYCSPTEDVERSCRFYDKDGILLRYQMYSARTIFKAPDGISLLYSNAAERKAAEEQAIMDISSEFPHLLSVRTGDSRRKTEAAMNFRFKSLGVGPLQADGKPREKHVPDHAPGRPETLSKDSMAKAAEEKVLLDRCVALQDELACPGHNKGANADLEEMPAQLRSCKQNEASGVDRSASSMPSAPCVLDDIVQAATRGRQKLSDLGFKLEPTPAESEPFDLDADDDFFIETSAVAPKVEVVQQSTSLSSIKEAMPAQAEEENVPPTPVMQKLALGACDHSSRRELPDSLPSAAGMTQLTTHIEENDDVSSAHDKSKYDDHLPSRKDDSGVLSERRAQRPSDLDVVVVEDSLVVPTTGCISGPDVLDDLSSCTFSGFHKSMLNTSYYVNQHIKVQGKKTFWEKNEKLFLYWQAAPKRWAIAQRFIGGEDFLLKIMRGELQGWAYQDNSGRWFEFRDVDKRWPENRDVVCNGARCLSASCADEAGWTLRVDHDDYAQIDTSMGVSEIVVSDDDDTVNGDDDYVEVEHDAPLQRMLDLAFYSTPQIGRSRCSLHPVAIQTPQRRSLHPSFTFGEA